MNADERVANSIPHSQISPLEFMPTRVAENFKFSPITVKEIEEEIDKLKVNKSSGPFSIPTSILKLIKHLIAKPLQTIFNSSLSNGIVPNSFKIASVIPIFKKGSRLNVNNYRPISLLSTFNKMIEKLVFKRLISFVNKNNILSKKQFGFRSNHSTIQAVLSITDKIQRAIEEGAYSCGIFLDLSKAFDSVNHNILIEKLQHYGVRDLEIKWFLSYLENRKQYVSFGCSNSELLPISCGVPQGSVLGPLLFLLFINDFQNSSSTFDFHLFADDSNLFYKSKNLNTLETIVNEQLVNISSWLRANKLLLNVDKSNFVIFHPPQKKVPYTLQLFIDNKALRQDVKIRYLGIIIDNHLSWKSHVAHICNKIKRSISVICKARHYVNSSILLNLYYALVYPYLIYGIIIWGQTYESTIKPLFILQKKLVRLMTFSDFNAHSNPIFSKLKILKLPDLVFLQTALFMYDFHSGNLPVSFSLYFTQVHQKHNYNTRLSSKSSYCLPRIRTNFGKFNIRFSGAKCWNVISESLKKLTNKNAFKEQLSDDLLKTYDT